MPHTEIRRTQRSSLWHDPMPKWLPWLSLTLGLFLADAVAAPAAAAPGDVAIVIANKHYRGAPPVEYADRDADAFAKAAVDVLQVGAEAILRRNDLTSEEARALVRPDGTPGEELAQLVRRARGRTNRKDGTIYFFYSGHGMPGQLVLHDLPPRSAIYEGLSIEALKKALVRLQQEHIPQGVVVLILDACFSGKVGGNGEALLSESSMVGMNAARIAQRADQRMLILAASSGNEVAWWDKDRRHGAFTDAVVDGLYGAAAGSDGKITASGLHMFVKRRVEERLARHAKAQTPELHSSEAADGSTVLASLRQPYPVRDPNAVSRERALCVALPQSREVGDLKAYLEACRAGSNSCICRQPVQEQLSKLEEVDRTCQAENEILAAIAKTGERGRDQLAALARGAGCAAVKVRASELLRVMTTSLPTTPPPAPQMPIPTGSCVVGVESWDTLRIRNGPNSRNTEIGRIPSNACGVTVHSECSGAWCKVTYQGTTGWANTSFLRSGYSVQAAPPPTPIAPSGSGSCVVGVEANDVLWVRSSPSPASNKVGSIPPNACGMRLHSQCQGAWCIVTYGSTTGWVNTRFIR